MDMGTNTSDVEARPHRDGTRVVTLDANFQTPLLIVNIMIPTSGEDQIALPQINLSISRYGPNSLQDCQFGSLDVRAKEISVLPQVDGPVSIPMRGNVRGRILESTRIMEWEYSKDGTYLPGTSVSHRREYPGDSSNDNRSYKGQRHPEEEGIQIRMGDYPIEGDILIGIEDLLEEEDILEEDPLMVEDPLVVEDPLMAMEDPLDPLVTRTTRSSRTSQTSETCYSADTSYNIGYFCIGRYI